MGKHVTCNKNEDTLPQQESLDTDGEQLPEEANAEHTEGADIKET